MKKLLNYVKDDQLVIIGGRPGAGKTTLSLQLMVKLAKYNKCLIYSIEMPAKIMESKIISICKEQNINYNAIKNNIVIDDNWELTIEKVKKDCLTNNYKYVFIDYAQLIKNHTINEYIKTLKEISNQLNISIIANSMTSRLVEYRENKETLLTDVCVKNIDLVDKIIIINTSNMPVKKFELYNEQRNKTELYYTWNNDKVIFENNQ